MFGAPVGIVASDENARGNIGTSLGALKTLGEIEQQPADLALKQAHARYYGAEAGIKESQAAAMQRMQSISQEVAARRALSASAAAQGTLATINDLPPSGNLVNKSQADNIEAVLAEAEQRGESEVNLIPLRKEASTIRQQEAAQAAHASAAVSSQLDAVKKINGIKGAFATAVLNNPDSYPQARLALSGMGIPTQGLPLTFDRRTFEVMRDQAIEADKAVDNARQAAKDKAQQPLIQAQTAAARAAVGVRAARTRLLQQEYDEVVKNGGKYSPEAIRRRQVLSDAKEQEMQAKDLLKYPPLPLSQELVTAGKDYTAKDGSKLRAMEDPNGTITGADGKKLSLVRTAPPPSGKRPVTRSSESAAEVLDEEAD